MKKLVIGVIAVVVLGGGATGFWYYHSASVAAANQASAVQTAKVERRNLRLSVMATGSVASNGDVDIKCLVGGTIQQFPYADVSAEVAPGALLLEIDPIDQIRVRDSKKAAVDADDAKLKEAQLNRDIATMSLDTTRKRNEAALASAKAKASDAKAKAARTQELFDRKLASKEDLETAQTVAALADSEVANAEAAMLELEQQKMQIATKELEIDQMRAQSKQDQANADTAEQNVKYCTVTAPLAENPKDPPQWVVTTVGTNLKPGSVIQSGTAGNSGGTTVMTLSDLSHMFVLATVDESDIGRVRVGQDVRLTADTFPGVEFRGKVIRIAPSGKVNSNVVTYEVKIEVISENKRLLKLVMTSNVEIIEAEKKSALVVPILAVSRQQVDADRKATSEPAAAATQQTRPSDDAKAGEGPFPATVQVVKTDGPNETRDILVGLNDGVDYLVLKGLEEGETVILNKLGDSKWRSGGPSAALRRSGH